jgi:hypothetical protein
MLLQQSECIQTSSALGSLAALFAPTGAQFLDHGGKLTSGANLMQNSSDFRRIINYFFIRNSFGLLWISIIKGVNATEIKKQWDAHSLDPKDQSQTAGPSAANSKRRNETRDS